MRHSRKIVFTGVIAALAAMTIISVLVGQVASFLPSKYVYYGEIILFIGFGTNESAVCRVISKVETLLINSGKFRLPGKKQLAQNAYIWDVLVSDVTESPPIASKKNSELTIVARKSGTL